MTLVEIRSSVSKVISKTKDLLSRIFGTILILDDNAEVLYTVNAALKDNIMWEIDTIPAKDLSEAKEALEHPALRAALVDYWIGDSTSEELCLELQSNGIPVIMMAGSSKDQKVIDFCKLHSIPIVAKPFTVEQIYTQLCEVILGGIDNDSVAK